MLDWVLNMPLISSFALPTTIQTYNKENLPNYLTRILGSFAKDYLLYAKNLKQSSFIEIPVNKYLPKRAVP